MTHLLSRARELTSDASGRYVDFGARVIAVRKNSERGVVPPGSDLPAVSKLHETTLGGRWDTVLNSFVGPCERPQVWLVGEKQFDILTKPAATRHALLYSAEGAGKTVLMAMWIWSRVFAAATLGIPGNLGATAPTAPRLGTLVSAVTDLAPVGTSREPVHAQWGTLYVDAGDLRTITGHQIQFRSTKQQSAAQGSPIQGWNWGLGAACDELQDSIHAYADIVARLRAGKDAPIMGTATAKDSPSWRSFRDGLNGEDWTIHRLQYTDTPFVHDSHWEMMQRNISKREWQRRGLALDVGPERMVYTSWDRKLNLRPFPIVPHAKDVTKEVLRRHGRGFELLLGHDPGTLQDYTIVLKAFRFARDTEHRWYVVDEFRTKNTTSEEHAHALRSHLASKWGVAPREALLRCDPYGTTDKRTDRSVYLIFKKAGFDIRSAAFSKQGKGNGVVPKEAGIEMVNSLICNAKNERRLFVVADERKQPATPLLVEALELSERDELGRAEMSRKHAKGATSDLSDPPAALRYALWQEERARFAVQTQGRAIA